MLWIILFVIYTISLTGLLIENAQLRAKIEAKRYEKQVLANRLKYFEGDNKCR